jgi:hypothetical protein
MNRLVVILLVLAGILILLGIVGFTVTLAAAGWDFSQISAQKYVKNEHRIKESFDNLSIVTDTAKIEILPSDDGSVRIVSNELIKSQHTVSVENGTLKIEINDTRKWYDFISFFSIGTVKIIVYLPSEIMYGELSIDGSTADIFVSRNLKFSSLAASISTGDCEILSSVEDFILAKTSTGDIKIEGLSATTVDLTSSTGAIELDGVLVAEDLKIVSSTGEVEIDNTSCRNLLINGDTSDIEMDNVIAKEKWTIELSTGNVEFEASDASQISIKTSTGSVRGSLLSEKVFITRTGTGSIDVPDTLTGGRCEITTGTGNIRITLK